MSFSNKFNFGQFRHYVQGFDLAWVVPLRIVKKFCRKLPICEIKKWGGKFRQLLKCCDSITAPTLTFSERNKKLLGKKLLPQKIVR